MIDEKKLIEFIKSNDFKRRIIQSKDSLQDILVQFITEQQKVGEWIPIDGTSELPKERRVYLVTYVTRTGKKYVRSAECSYSGKTPRYIEWSKKLNGIVIAWMPLPEPYLKRGEDNEK